MWPLIKWYSLLSTCNLIRSKQNKIIKLVTHAWRKENVQTQTRTHTFAFNPVCVFKLLRAWFDVFSAHTMLWIFVRKIIPFKRKPRRTCSTSLFEFMVLLSPVNTTPFDSCVLFPSNSCRLNIANTRSPFIQFRTIFSLSLSLHLHLYLHSVAYHITISIWGVEDKKIVRFFAKQTHAKGDNETIRIKWPPVENNFPYAFFHLSLTFSTSSLLSNVSTVCV